MKDNKSIHVLARPNEKSGKITFIHPHDNKEHYFYTCINDLSGSRMSAFDNETPGIDDSKAWIKSIFKGIREKATVISEIGDF